MLKFIPDRFKNEQTTASFPKENSPINTEREQKIAKIHINRLLDDYGLDIESLRKEYYEESRRISSDMARRNISSSGLHIKAQKNHAIATKDKINKLFTKLTRDIEDILLENYTNHIFKEIASLRKEHTTYVLSQEKNKDLCQKMVDNVQSWEVKINGSVNTTKNFTLE